MALIKKYPWKGFDPEYWLIVEYRIDLKSKKTLVGLSLYKDAATRAIDKAKPQDDWAGLIGRENFSPSIHQFVLDGAGLTLAECYAAIKAHPVNTFFADAIDAL